MACCPRGVFFPVIRDCSGKFRDLQSDETLTVPKLTVGGDRVLPVMAGEFFNDSGSQIDKGRWVFWEEGTESLQLATHLDTHNAAQILGITLEDIPDFSNGLIQVTGLVDFPSDIWKDITGGVGLIDGRDYWLRSNGNMLPDPPSSGFLSNLGLALSTTQFLMRPILYGKKA